MRWPSFSEGQERIHKFSQSSVNKHCQTVSMQHTHKRKGRITTLKGNLDSMRWNLKNGLCSCCIRLPFLLGWAISLIVGPTCCCCDSSQARNNSWLWMRCNEEYSCWSNYDSLECSDGQCLTALGCRYRALRLYPACSVTWSTMTIYANQAHRCESHCSRERIFL